MLSKAFGPNSIALLAQELEFTQACKFATELLVQDGKAHSSYVTEVLENLSKLGPYFVIAPGVALVHAKPSASVNEVGFSLLHLAAGSISGSENDPVKLVFAFCSTDADSHIDLLGQFAESLSAPGKMNLLLNASAESVIRSLL